MVIHLKPLLHLYHSFILVWGVICSVNFKKDLLSRWVSNSQIICLHTTLVYKSTTAAGVEERAGGNWERGDFESWSSNYCTVVGINFLACCVLLPEQNKTGPCLKKLHQKLQL